MLLWQIHIPAYLNKKRSIVFTIMFTSLFALAFINFYKPFNVTPLYHFNELQLLLYSSMVILTGVLVVVISRIIMYQYVKGRNLNYIQYIIWVMGEIVSMAVFFTLFVKFALDDSREVIDVFWLSVRNTALIILLPYSVVWLYLSWRDKSERLEKLSSREEETHSSKMIPFYDEKGTLRFSVVFDDLLYLEAADNYITIYYSDKQKTSKFMVRNTLKNIEIQLDNPALMRCHRSYLINFNKVKVIKREKEGIFLLLDAEEEIRLPVSKTYISSVIKSFSSELI